MDKDAEQRDLQAEKKYVEDWLNHPVTKQVLADNQDQQDQLITLLCQRTITNVETFFGHFEAIGHLRGLRRMRGQVEAKLEDIEEQLKEL